VNTGRRHHGERGQVIPLIAIAAVALFAFAALAIDGGLSFNDRRNDQAIADHASVAGAQKLVSSSPTALEQTAARTRAFEYVQRGLGTWTGAPPATCILTVNPATCTPAPGYSVTITTPLSAPINGWDPNHLVSVGISHQLKGTFLGAAGLGSTISIGAPAVAVNQASLPSPVHVVWSTSRTKDTNGGGNELIVTSPATHNSDPSYIGQVDDGSGTCTTPLLDVFSNEKIHAQNGSKNWTLNVNGGVDLTKFSHDQNDNEALLQYWQSIGPGFGSTPDLDPHYSAPTDDTSKYATDPAPSVSGTTVTFSPGRYTKDLVVQRNDPRPARWTGATSFVFQNGVYWFDNHSLTFAAGAYEAHSQDYQTASGSFGARTGTTDGVEFYLTKGATFSAQGGTINLQAPAKIAPSLRRPIVSTTPLISIYVDSKDTGDTNSNTTPTRPNAFPGWVNVPVAIGSITTPSYPAGQYFHEQGVIYVQDTTISNKKAGALLSASSTDPLRYGVVGQLVAPYVALNIGTVSTTKSTACPTTPPTAAGKLTQYNSSFVPTSTPGADTVLLQ